MNFSALKNRLGKLSDKSLAVNTGWMMLAQFFRPALQAIYFVIVARVLGVEQYGAFVSVVALIGILAPFVGLGIGNLLIKNVSRDRSLFDVYWGNALFLIFFTGLFLTILVVFLQPWLLPETISVWVLIFVAAADLIFTRIIDTAAKAFQAVEQLRGTSFVSTSLFVVRASAALIMLQAFSSPDAVTWAALYFASTLVTAAIAVIMVGRMLGHPRLELSRIRSEIGEGFYFSVSHSGQLINGNIDKVMLSRLSTLEATGIYAAAYRLIAVAMAPVRSLLYASYARFFKKGEAGIGGSLTVARRLLPLSIVYGLLAMVGIILFAPIVPLILGDEYSTSVAALRWLAPMPLLMSMHFIASDTLSGSGHQSMRSVIIMFAAFLNAGLNLWLIPTYSWLGAAWSSLGSDSFLVISLWAMVVFYYRKSKDSGKIQDRKSVELVLETSYEISNKELVLSDKGE